MHMQLLRLLVHSGLSVTTRLWSRTNHRIVSDSLDLDVSVVHATHRYKTPAEVAAEGRDAELDQQVSFIESTWGLLLAPGYDPQLTCMAHLWEVREGRTAAEGTQRRPQLTRTLRVPHHTNHLESRAQTACIAAAHKHLCPRIAPPWVAACHCTCCSP